MPEAANDWDKIADNSSNKPVKDMESYNMTLDCTRKHVAASDELLKVGCGTGSTALLAGLLTPLLCLIVTVPGCTPDTSCRSACFELEKCELSSHGQGLRDIVCNEDPCGGDYYPDNVSPDDAEGQAGCVVTELNKIATCLLWADGGLWDPIDSDRFCGSINAIMTGSPASIHCIYGHPLELVPQLRDRLSSICRVSLPPKK